MLYAANLRGLSKTQLVEKIEALEAELKTLQPALMGLVNQSSRKDKETRKRAGQIRADLLTLYREHFKR